ncbi:TatD family hydrolase [Caldivirga maquilingensis]|uniref:TatD-related deoxyribonuclease n=1 Tax=Caldivirga maquilingensis (strain ATCC 700844 / DSM 13496 / JCM 10307 / IC-167) TaxID=397948 RepID=A8MBX6_CALMQ|nr:TatD family hydrolase [Caldivirga maquilingensis]ABW01319.1 TatD-related deoxyribonuclease [Caldivirga maquilingensis IC-167]
MSKALPIADNHTHVNPVKGLGPREVARRFKRTGGWFMGVVALLTWDLGLNPGDLSNVDKMYRLTIESTKIIQGEGVKAVAVVGVHPAECVKLLESGWGFSEVKEFMIKTIDLAAQYIRRGEAVGIGEIGRPHWSVNEGVVDLCNEIIEYAMGTARDLNAIIHLHLERKGEATVKSIVELANKAGVKDKGRIILHHASPSMVKPAVDNELKPSIPVGRRGEFEEAVKLTKALVVESDYADDPRRPGMVIPPWRILSRINNALNQGLLSEDDAFRIMVNEIEETYGVKYEG